MSGHRISVSVSEVTETSARVRVTITATFGHNPAGVFLVQVRAVNFERDIEFSESASGEHSISLNGLVAGETYSIQVTELTGTHGGGGGFITLGTPLPFPGFTTPTSISGGFEGPRGFQASWFNSQAEEYRYRIDGGGGFSDWSSWSGNTSIYVAVTPTTTRVAVGVQPRSSRAGRGREVRREFTRTVQPPGPEMPGPEVPIDVPVDVPDGPILGSCNCTSHINPGDDAHSGDCSDHDDDHEGAGPGDGPPSQPTQPPSVPSISGRFEGSTAFRASWSASRAESFRSRVDGGGGYGAWSGWGGSTSRYVSIDASLTSITVQVEASNVAGRVSASRRFTRTVGTPGPSGSCSCGVHNTGVDGHPGDCDDHQDDHDTTTVVAPPPPEEELEVPLPTNIRVGLSISGTSASARAVADGEDYFEMRWFRGSQGWLNAFRSTGGESTLSGLNPGEEVAIQARACNDAGCGNTASKSGVVPGAGPTGTCSCGHGIHVGSDCNDHAEDHGPVSPEDDPVPTNASLSLSLDGESAVARITAEGASYYEMHWTLSGSAFTAFTSRSGQSTLTGLRGGEHVVIRARACSTGGCTSTLTKELRVPEREDDDDMPSGDACSCGSHEPHVTGNCDDHESEHTTDTGNVFVPTGGGFGGHVADTFALGPPIDADDLGIYGDRIERGN